jgi:dTMP kinase
MRKIPSADGRNCPRATAGAPLPETYSKLGFVSQGLFLTFEGLDGSGKTTQLQRLATSLEAEGHTVVSLRQPGGTALGDRIRALLLDSRSEAELGTIAPETEMALMFADRAQSLREIILPALATGSIVLCDRYTDSSEAYQGAGRGLGADRILAMHQAVCNGFQPHLTLLLLPPLAASLRRARRRNRAHVRKLGTDENRFEREDDEFYARVYEQYREIARREPKRIVAIEDDAPIEAVSERILEVVRSRLPAPPPAVAPQSPALKL